MMVDEVKYDAEAKTAFEGNGTVAFQHEAPCPVSAKQYVKHQDF